MAAPRGAELPASVHLPVFAAVLVWFDADLGAADESPFSSTSTEHEAGPWYDNRNRFDAVKNQGRLRQNHVILNPS